MTRILYLATNFYPFRGGLENYLIELGSRLVVRGYAVDVLTYNTRDLPDHEEHNGVGIYRIPCYDILKDVYSLPRFNRKTKKIMAELKENGYDYVITQTRFFSTSWLGMRFASKNGIKYVHTEHGNVHVKHDNKLIQSLAWLYDMTIGKRIFKKAWKVVGISKPCCDFAIKMGAAKDKVHLIYNSIDTEKFKPSDKRDEWRKGLDFDKVTISYAGRLIYAKGLHDLIKAVKGLNVKLYLMGIGPYRDELNRLADENGVDVEFPGEVQPDHVCKATIASDILCNPSYSEGLPTTVLEGSSCGVPVVATDVGGTREIIKDGETGYLVKPNDVEGLRKAITKLLDDRDLRLKMGREGRKRVVELFDWNRNVDKYIEEIFI